MTTEVSTKLYAGLDLHSNNTYCAVINQGGQPLFQKRLANDLPLITQALQPYQKALACKLAKAAYYVLRDNVEFSEQKMFG
jgi:hypothetical protein